MAAVSRDIWLPLYPYFCYSVLYPKLSLPAISARRVQKIAAALVTNRGGRTCHAAIVARELGIPAVVGTEHATEKLREGELVTVSCADGSVGKVCRDRVMEPLINAKEFGPLLAVCS
jgi:phosphoenolpyruvate-protein kinase (PTS system EI component)